MLLHFNNYVYYHWDGKTLYLKKWNFQERTKTFITLIQDYRSCKFQGSVSRDVFANWHSKFCQYKIELFSEKKNEKKSFSPKIEIQGSQILMSSLAGCDMSGRTLWVFLPKIIMKLIIFCISVPLMHNNACQICFIQYKSTWVNKDH